MGNSVCRCFTSPGPRSRDIDAGNYPGYDWNNWLDGVYGALQQPSPAVRLQYGCNLYHVLSSETVSVYEIPRLNMQAKSTAPQRVITTNRAEMVTVEVEAKPDWLALSRRKVQITENIRVKARAGFAGFVGAEVDAPLSVCCPCMRESLTHGDLLKIYRSHPSDVIIWNNLKKPFISPLRASAAIDRVLDPSFVQTHKQCVVVGTCYNDCQGMLRVLEWVDNAEAGFRTLHCKYILFNVPIWLMTAYMGADVSSSLVLRHHTEPESQQLPSVNILSNDRATWDTVRKSKVQLAYKPEPVGAAAPKATPWSFPSSEWHWRDTLFGTQGKLDYGADRIGKAAGSGLHLCASIPAMLALAITKVEDFREVNLNLYTYQAKGQAINIHSIDGGRGINGCGHMAATNETELVGRELVAAVLAFNRAMPENQFLYLWD